MGSTPPAVPMITTVIGDLAARLGIQPGEVVFISSEEVDWRDSSLGCAEPGMRYMTVIVPGYRIMLEAAGKQYEYHTALKDSFVLCEKGRPVK